MSDVLVRMLKLQVGPDGARHIGKHYSVSAAEAKVLVDAEAAVIVTVPDKRPAVERATRKAPENADVRPREVPKGPTSTSGASSSATTTVESEEARRERYTKEARDAGIAEDLIAGEVQDRELFDMLVADGAVPSEAATEVWGGSPPSHPWIPQPGSAAGDRSGDAGPPKP